MQAAQPAIHRERISFKNDGNTLVAYVYKPPGAGPFPAVLWNHGSEEKPTPEGQFQTVAEVVVPAGYVLFAPMRRGQGESEGPYIVHVIEKFQKDHSRDEVHKLIVQLLSGPQLEDQLAGLERLKKLEYVNPLKLAVMGCSYGGIQTLLAAERRVGFKGAIAMSPAAESWESSEFLRERLANAAKNIDIPVLIMHPKRDNSVKPGYVLGQLFEQQHKPYGLFIVPPYGPQQAQEHCFGGIGSNSHSARIWSPAVLQFLNHVLD